jgi:hypothetical protein
MSYGKEGLHLSTLARWSLALYLLGLSFSLVFPPWVHPDRLGAIRAVTDHWAFSQATQPTWINDEIPPNYGHWEQRLDSHATVSYQMLLLQDVAISLAVPFVFLVVIKIGNELSWLIFHLKLRLLRFARLQGQKSSKPS